MPENLATIYLIYGIALVCYLKPFMLTAFSTYVAGCQSDWYVLL